MSGHRGHGRRGRKAAAHEEEHENHERWAVSYADMMTVLVGLFIVMYAISQVDQTKFEELRASLAIGFGHQAPSMLPGSSGPLTGIEAMQITPDLSSEPAYAEVPAPAETRREATEDGTLTEDERNALAARAELERLEDIARRVATALESQQLGDRVRFRINERGLSIGMVADDVFFSADAAELTGTALRVIDTVSPVLAQLPDQLSVEGHANVLPSAAYPTNWELSADRATQVLRRMVEAGGVAPHRIAAVGFGDARPLNEAGRDPLEVNRRVDVVVLSSVPEEIRALLPALAKEDA